MSPHEVMLYGHGGSANRGCDAIVRSTAAILKEHLGPETVVRLISLAPEEDRKACLPDIQAVVDSGKHGPLYSPVRLARAILRRAWTGPSASYILDNLRTIYRAGKADVCLSVGGDNYCYDPVEMHYGLNRLLRKRCCRMVFWGCSIEPERMDKAMLEDLRGFDLITARETLTYAALKDRGIDRVRLYPDPAFTMEEERLPLPTGWREGEMLGLNVSPLVERYARHPGHVSGAVAELVRHVLATTGMGIVLVPHVTWVHSDDRVPLRSISKSFSDSGRVFLLSGDLNAPQLKGYISRCRLFVGARTHATIAAYSSGVPTLVMGYSVKARGIARDLMGTEEGLLLPVQELSDSRMLVRMFEGLRERESEIRERLSGALPSYIRSAREAGSAVRQVVGAD